MGIFNTVRFEKIFKFDDKKEIPAGIYQTKDLDQDDMNLYVVKNGGFLFKQSWVDKEEVNPDYDPTINKGELERDEFVRNYHKFKPTRNKRIKAGLDHIEIHGFINIYPEVSVFDKDGDEIWVDYNLKFIDSVLVDVTIEKRKIAKHVRE